MVGAARGRCGLVGRLSQWVGLGGVKSGRTVDTDGVQAGRGDEELDTGAVLEVPPPPSPPSSTTTITAATTRASAT